MAKEQRYQFSLSTTLIIVLVFGVGISSLIGYRLRRQRRARLADQKAADVMSDMEERIYLTGDLLQDEQAAFFADIGPKAHNSSYIGQSSSFGADGQLSMGITVGRLGNYVVNVHVRATSNEDGITPIEIEDRPAKENRRFVDRLCNAYEERGWAHRVIRLQEDSGSENNDTNATSNQP